MNKNYFGLPCLKIGLILDMAINLKEGEMKRINYLREFVDNTIKAYRAFLPPIYYGKHPNEHGIKERISELKAVKEILEDPKLED